MQKAETYDLAADQCLSSFYNGAEKRSLTEVNHSLITAVRNIFTQTKIRMDGVSVEYLIL